MVERQPAPRPNESNFLMAPMYMPLEEDGLQVNLGCIPGEEMRFLEEDFGENYPSGRGMIP